MGLCHDAFDGKSPQLSSKFSSDGEEVSSDAQKTGRIRLPAEAREMQRIEDIGQFHKFICAAFDPLGKYLSLAVGEFGISYIAAHIFIGRRSNLPRDLTYHPLEPSDIEVAHHHSA